MRSTAKRGAPWLRIPRLVLAGAVIGVGLGVPFSVDAAPVIINSANVWRADRTPNPIGFLPTALVPWVSVTTGAGGDVNATLVTAAIGGTTYNLTRIPTGALAGLYFAEIPYDPLLTGDWTITATNNADSASRIRPGFVPVAAMPFLSSISFTGTGTNITVHWALTPAAEARLDEQQVAIWDVTNPFAPVTVQFFNIGVAPRQVDLSALALTPGRQYAVEINSVDRNANTGFVDVFSGNWLTGWSPTPGGPVRLPPAVPESSSLSLLVAGLATVALRRKRRTNSPR